MRRQIVSKILTLILVLGFLVGAGWMTSRTVRAAAPIYVRPGGDDTNCDGTADVDYAAGLTACAVQTIQKGIDLVDAGGTVYVGAGTYVLSAVVNVSKAGITLDGDGAGSTIVQVSGTGDRFNITAAGITLQEFEIVKTDKIGTQEIIRISNGNDVTIKNNTIHGQFVIGDGDVSRAIAVNAGSFAGLNIEGNTIYGLRQPAYISGTSAGTIINNYVYGTKGWVLEGGNLTFTGNTWGTGADTNVYDIAILSTMPAGYYTDIVAMSNANNGAVIEDQRVSPAVLSAVYVDASTSHTSDLGGRYHPYSTIAPAITRVVSGGTIYIAAGDYTENIAVVDKVMHFVGAIDAGGNPLPRIVGTLSIDHPNAGDAFRRIENINFSVGSTGNGIDLKNVDQGVTITNCTFDGNNLFMSGKNGVNIFSGPNGNNHITIDDCTFQNGLYVGVNGYANYLTVKDSSFANVKSGINLQGGGGNLVVENTDFSVVAQAASSDTYGIRFASSTGSVPNMTVTGGSITVDKAGLTADPGTYHSAIVVRAAASGVLEANNISINGEVVNLSPVSLDAECNYWQTIVMSEIAAKITGLVDWSPWADSGLSSCTYTWPVHNITQVTDHPTIQAAIDAASAGDVIEVDAGTYQEDVNINKSLTVEGAGPASTTIEGIIGGDIATVRVAANNVTIAGFTITRQGNNITDWNNPGLNSAGIALQGAYTGMLVRDNILTGNRTAIDINNSSGHTIRNNKITFNRTGLLMRNQTDNLTVVENEITDNWTMGILFLDASSGSNSPVQTALNSTFSNNNISGNWYGQIVDRQSGGSLPAPGTTNLKDFSGNWYGTTPPVVSTADSAEPGYAAQIPEAFGGSAVAPGGQPDILGPASANFDFTPYLSAGTDTDVETTAGRGVFGFQGDFSELWVDDDSPQIGTTGRIQEGINLVSGSTVNVAAGTYNEAINVDSRTNLTVAGEDRDTTIIRPTTTLPWNVGGYTTRRTVVRVVNSTNFTLRGVTVDCDLVKANNLFATLFWDSTGTLDDNIIENTSVPDTAGGYSEFGGAFRTTSFTDAARAQITVSNSVYKDTGRVALLVHDYVHMTVTENEFYKTSDDFGYAMEIGSQSTASVSGNKIHGYDTPAASDGSGSAGIYIENSFTASSPSIVKSVSLTDNEIYDSQVALYIGNEFNNYAGDVDIVVTATGNYFHNNLEEGVIVTDEDKAGGSSVTYVGSGNTLSDNGDVGYFVFTRGDGDITVSIDGDTISGHGVGVYLNDYGSVPGGSSYNVDIHNSSIVNNIDFGVQNAYSGTTLDATLNWWGSVCSPASVVEGLVDYNPWWGDAAGTFEVSEGASGLIIPDGATGPETNAILACVAPNSIVDFEAGGTFGGGIVVSTNGLTLNLNGGTVGAGSPAFTINAADVTIQGPGVLDGDGDASPGILVNAGANNFILDGVEVREWANGVELAGDVTSFKIVSNWIHSNTGNGLLIDADVDLDGVVAIEGNLFKVNGGNGIQHNGNGTLFAEYNSWGDVGGPASGDGDGVGGTVDADPWTFAEIYLDVDPDSEAIERNENEGDAFNVALKVEAEKLYGLAFSYTYDTNLLTLNSTTFTAPWIGRCTDLSTLGEVAYVCYLMGGPEWDGGTVATFNFSANGAGLTGDGPWTAIYNISHLEADTSAGAIGGVKVFVNNAGYNAPSTAARDITDTNDGQINITGLANFTGFINLQGRPDDSGAVIQVYGAAPKAGAVLLAQGASVSSGAYTTAYETGQQLTVGTTYYFQVDRALYVPTTAMKTITGLLPAVPDDWQNYADLLVRPLTTLNTVLLLGGDATDDDMIELSDAVCIGAQYGSAAPVACGTGADFGAGTSADVNGDGKVDLLDLVLMGGNYEKNSSPWIPQ